MPPTMLRISTAAVVLVLFLAVPLTQTQARTQPAMNSASSKVKQIDELEQRLREPYGAETWFVFAFTTVQPDFSGGVTISRGRHHRYGYAQMRVGRRLVFRSCTVQGSRAAAELIWQAQQASLPLRFYYRGFENEAQAVAFRTLMSP